MRNTRILIIVLAAPLLLGAELPFTRKEVNDYVLGRLSDTAGRELTVAGDVEIDLGWDARVSLGKVQVANADWGEAPYLLSVDRLEVTLDMRALLKGEVRLPRLGLVGPRLFLETAPDGEANWILGGEGQTIVESAAAPGGEPGNLPDIGLIEVSQGELAFRDAGTDDPRWVRGTIEEAGGSIDQDGVDFAANGRLGEELYTLVVRAAPLADLRAGERAHPLYLMATAGTARLMVDGTVVAPFELRGLDLALSAHGGGLHQLPLVTGLPESPPFDLRARLVRDAGPWELRDLGAAIGRSDMRGNLLVDLTGERPRIEASFAADTLAVTELLALAPATEDEPAPAQQDDPLAALGAVDARASFSAGELLVGNLRLAEVQARMQLEDGLLTLAPISAATGGGRVSTRLRLDPDPLSASAEIRFNTVDLQQAFVELDLGDRPLGVLDGTLAVVLPPPPPGGEAEAIDPPAILRRLRIEEGRVTYREPGQDTDLALALQAGPGVSAPLVQGEGRFRGAPVAINLTTDPPLNAVTGGAPLRAEGTVRVGATVGHIDATLADVADPTRLEATFDLTGDFEELAELTGANIPALPPLSAEGRLHRTGPLWTLAGLDVRLGESDLSGTLAVDASGPRPQIGADLASETIDFAALLPDEDGDAGAQDDPADGEAAGDAPWQPPEILTEVDARVAYRAGRLVTETATVDDLAVAARLEDGRLSLKRLRLAYVEPEQDTRLAVRLEQRGDESEKGTEARLTGEAHGRFRGRPVKADLATDAVLDLTESGPPGAWRIALSPGDTRLTASGQLADLLSGDALAVRVSAAGPSAARLSDLIGVDLPRTPAYDLEASVTRDGNDVVVDDLSGRVGRTDLSGRVSVGLASDPPNVDARLTSRRLDYDQLTAALGGQGKGKGKAAAKGAGRTDAGPARLFSDEPLALRGLTDAVQGRVRYQARSVTARKLPLDNLLVDARLAKGNLTLAPLRFGLAGGKVRLGLDMDTSRKPLRADLDGDVRGVDLRKALAGVELADESFGIVSGELKLWMKGNSIAELAGSADGGLFLLMTGGAFDMLLVEVAGLDPGEALFAAFSDERVPIDCAYLNLRSRGGKVNVSTFAVDTRDTLFLADGGLDLDRELVELVIEPRPKDPSVLTFSSPIRIKGALRSPQVQVLSGELIGRAALAVGLAFVQPFAALIPLIEPGTGGESPYCGGLMEAMKEAHR